MAQNVTVLHAKMASIALSVTVLFVLWPIYVFMFCVVYVCMCLYFAVLLLLTSTCLFVCAVSMLCMSYVFNIYVKRLKLTKAYVVCYYLYRM